jgi:hypothetical protein
MFKRHILKVVDSIKEKTTIFKDTGFVLDLKNQGGFLGITDEYTNYFYARIESEDAEGDPYLFTYDDSKRLTINFSFKLVFSIVKDVPSFDIMMMHRINKVQGVTVLSLDDVTESIYTRETGVKLKNENFTLYSYSCQFSKETNLSNLINCIDEETKQYFC